MATRTTGEPVAPADGRPTVLLVGHGSRDPRSAGELRALADAVAAAAPDVAVELAFLELSEPRLEDVAAGLTGEVVVVPLLLTSAFHARFDLPGRLAAIADERNDVRFSRSDVLGPDPALDAAVASRGAALLADGCDGLVLLGTGSSHTRANAEVDAVASRVSSRLGVPVAAGFVTRGQAMEDASAQVRATGSTRVGIVPWFLAPGLLLDAGLARAAEVGVVDAAPTLARDLAHLVLARAQACHAVPAAA